MTMPEQVDLKEKVKLLFGNGNSPFLRGEGKDVSGLGPRIRETFQ